MKKANRTNEPRIDLPNCITQRGDVNASSDDIDDGFCQNSRTQHINQLMTKRKKSTTLTGSVCVDSLTHIAINAPAKQASKARKMAFPRC